MMHLCKKIGKTLALFILFPAIACLCSCRSAFLTPFTICNPFASVDHVQLTHFKAASSVINTRVKPATAVTGKQQLTLNDCKALAISNCPDLKVTCLEELSKGYAAKSFAKRMFPHLVLVSELGETEAPRWYVRGASSVWHTIHSGFGRVRFAARERFEAVLR